jgi:receptor tyrosine kinase
VRLPLCYEDCIATQQLYCYNDWVLIEEKKQRGLYLKTRGHFRLPECEELPRYNKSAKIPTCSYVGLTEINPNEVSCKLNINSIEDVSNVYEFKLK